MEFDAGVNWQMPHPAPHHGNCPVFPVDRDNRPALPVPMFARGFAVRRRWRKSPAASASMVRFQGGGSSLRTGSNREDSANPYGGAASNDKGWAIANLND
jgi:hypothetical protein